MDHIVLPLDPDHVEALDEVVAGLVDALGLTEVVRRSSPHVTLLAYEGVPAADVASAVAPVAAASEPFTIHAHGYGFFTGPASTDLSLHVPVVRTAPIDELHEALCRAARDAGAEVAGWTAPPLWTPHITLLDRQLDPARLGAAAAWLAQRRHPSWRIPVDRVALTGGWPDRHRVDAELPLGGGETAEGEVC